ncbi:MAG: acyl-CoA thioesterase [Myxococcales bacterium]|nr:acyl-CoA thioesterase [Myxococcales bacterium]
MKSPEFRHPLIASDEDIDALGHVNNVVYLRWIQDAASAHSAAVGYDMAAYRASGAAFVVRRHEIDFVRPCFAGDALEVITWVDGWRPASSVRCSRVVRRGDDVEVARARTLWAFINLETGGPARITEAVIEAFMGPRA